jgi:hypothetical protein
MKLGRKTNHIPILGVSICKADGITHYSFDKKSSLVREESKAAANLFELHDKVQNQKVELNSMPIHSETLDTQIPNSSQNEESKINFEDEVPEFTEFDLDISTNFEFDDQFFFLEDQLADFTNMSFQL